MWKYPEKRRKTMSNNIPQLSDQKAIMLLEQAKVLRKEFETSGYKFGVILNAIKRTGAYKAKYNNFSEYCKNDLEIHGSTGYSFIKAAFLIEKYKLKEGTPYWRVLQAKSMLAQTDRAKMIDILELPPAEFRETVKSNLPPKPHKTGKTITKPPEPTNPFIEAAVNKAIALGFAKNREEAFIVISKFFTDYAEEPKEPEQQMNVPPPIDYTKGDFTE
jgi:hypothetical protein